MVYRRIDFKGIFFCIAMATVIWFFHALNKTYSTKVKYPLELTIKQSNVVALIPTPKFIELNVFGEGWAILRTKLGLGIEPIHVEVKNPTKVRHLALNSFLGVLQKNLVDLKINGFVADSLDLHYEQLASKEVAIRIHAPDIALRENYRITSPIHIEPAKMIFKGAVSLVDKISDTIFVTLQDTDIARDYNRKTKVALPEHLHLESTQEDVNVSFTVAPFIKNSKILPLTLLYFPKDSTSFVQETTGIVQYQIPENLPDRLVPDTMHIILDYRLFNPIDSTIKPYLNKLPDFIAEPIIAPAKFKVKFKK
jgi:hypothetical protein